MQTTGQVELAPKLFTFRGCLAALLSIIIGILGVLIGLITLYLGYVFSVAGMLHRENLILISLAALSCALVIFTASRLKPRNWIVSLIIVTFILLFDMLFLGSLFDHATALVVVNTSSMKEGLTPHDYVFVDLLAYQTELPHRGDIIVHHDQLDHLWIKRVIGLPGETVKIQSGQVYINGILLKEPDYILKDISSGQWQVGDAQYFMLGDCRGYSIDSRWSGNVAMEAILGRVSYIYYPFSREGKVPNDYSTP